jgi:flagellar basal body-associated protein FliL
MKRKSILGIFIMFSIVIGLILLPILFMSRRSPREDSYISQSEQTENFNNQNELLIGDGEYATYLLFNLPSARSYLYVHLHLNFQSLSNDMEFRIY